MSDRLNTVKRAALARVLEINPGYAAESMAHLGYVACLGALIARARGLDMELAQVAGYLHDIWLHERHPYSQEIANAHACEGAKLAREIMVDIGEFTDVEIKTVCDMIFNHDFINQTDSRMDEILKDADMLSHYLNASAAGNEAAYHPRVAAALRELGCVVA